MKLLKFIIIGACFLTLFNCNKEDSNFDAEGTFEATEVIISAEANGRILNLNIREGQVLTSGQPIGNIDDTQLVLQKEQLLANIKYTESRRPDIQIQTASLEEQLAAAQIEQRLAKDLSTSGTYTQKQLDDINAKVAIYEKQLIALKDSLKKESQGISNQVAAMKIQLKQIENSLSKCVLVSPINGTVLAKYSEAGELAVQGKALFKLADLENMFLRVYITSRQLSQVSLGQTVEILADQGNTTKTYTGTVTWISNQSEFTPKAILTKDERANLVYAVKIAFMNDGYVRIGMYGKMKLDGRPL